jgi:glycosyltransferase involved in cell wall biosynthesis
MPDPAPHVAPAGSTPLLSSGGKEKLKLIIQIPCYNEERSLGATLRALPRQISGVDVIEWLIVDDGSSDGTAEVARELGVDHIVRHTTNQGLARAFATGLDACLRLGADIIVNTDADNQYDARDIASLIGPILRGDADMVVGDRQTDAIAHFSRTKKKLQRLGSWVVRRASQTDIPDATSGFRAHSRAAALKLNVVSDFTYTLETIIQAGRKNIALAHVAVRTNHGGRESRLFQSLRAYVLRSIVTIVRIYVMYRPVLIFLTIGGVLFTVGFLIGCRFVYHFLSGTGAGRIQSLLLAVLLMVVGFQAGLTGLIADLIANNRRLVEETLWRVRRLELENFKAGADTRFTTPEAHR